MDEPLPSTTLTLPVDSKELGKFISGLLGQPQSLEREFEVAFDVDHNWLIHLCALVVQRIEQQNEPQPLTFTATVIYRDGYRREISSFPAFQHFSETQNLVSTGIAIKIAILIRFPNKSVPERQELTIYFDTNEAWRKHSSWHLLIAPRYATTGYINVELRHTERTWADDILRLVESEIQHVTRKELRLRSFLRKTIFPVAALLFPFSMLLSIGLTRWQHRRVPGGSNDELTHALHNSGVDLGALHTKVDALIEDRLAGANDDLALAVVVVLSLAVSITLLVAGTTLARPPASFLVLTKAAQNYRTETMQKQKRKNLWLLLSVMGSVAVGVIGNFVYDWLKQ